MAYQESRKGVNIMAKMVLGMFHSSRIVAIRVVAPVIVFCATVVLGQPKGEVPGASNAYEFPVSMQQDVMAGKTPIGTKAEARLELATLVNGTVIPAGAIFSGEVIESVAKSATEPSRLAIRMDSVRWKTGSATLKTYLTAWQNPTRSVRVAQFDAVAAPASAGTTDSRGTAAGGDYTQPSPSLGGPQGPDVPAISRPSVSHNRVLMKDVEPMRRSDGGTALICRKRNIKLDKSTTYFLEPGNVTQTK